MNTVLLCVQVDKSGCREFSCHLHLFSDKCLHKDCRRGFWLYTTFAKIYARQLEETDFKKTLSLNLPMFFFYIRTLSLSQGIAWLKHPKSVLSQHTCWHSMKQTEPRPRSCCVAFGISFYCFPCLPISFASLKTIDIAPLDILTPFSHLVKGLHLSLRLAHIFSAPLPSHTLHMSEPLHTSWSTLSLTFSPTNSVPHFLTPPCIHPGHFARTLLTLQICKI